MRFSFWIVVAVAGFALLLQRRGRLGRYIARRVPEPRRTILRYLWGHLLATCAVSIAAAVATVSHTVSASEFLDADDLILRLMSKENVHGAAVALIKDNRIVLEKGYGVRDIATQPPVTTATLFNIGSISKSFTALGVAQLVDQQKADLDVPVINYLPDLQLRDSGVAQTLTLRRLPHIAVAFPQTSTGPSEPRRHGTVSSPSSRGWRLPRRLGHSFNIAPDASSSQRASSNGSPANRGRPIPKRTYSCHLG